MGWTSIYQLFWCSPGVQGFDTLPCGKIDIFARDFWDVWGIFLETCETNIENEDFLTDFWWIHLVDGKKIPLDQDNIFFTVPLWLVMTWLPSLLVKSKILGQSCQICVANFPHIWLSNSFVRLLHPAIPSGTRWEISWRRTNIWPRELGDLRGWQLSGWSLVKKWRYPLVN